MSIKLTTKNAHEIVSSLSGDLYFDVQHYQQHYSHFPQGRLFVSLQVTNHQSEFIKIYISDFTLYLIRKQISLTSKI